MVIDESLTGGKKIARTLNLTATKNTHHLFNAGVAKFIVRLMSAFRSDAEVTQWAARAVNNLGKSRTLKQELIQNEVLAVLTDVAEIHLSGDKDVNVWIKLATETIQTTVAPAATGLNTERTPLHNMFNPADAITGTFADLIGGIEKTSTRTSRSKTESFRTPSVSK